MMSFRPTLFSRYVFRQVASAFLLILLTLTGIVWMATALKQLDLLTSKGQGILLFLHMTMLTLPSLIGLIAPNAVLMSVLYTLDRMNSDSEVIVTAASGGTIWRIGSALLALAAIVSSLILMINVFVTPASSRALRDLILEVRTDLISQVLQPGRFSSPMTGLTFHIRDRDDSGDMLGLLVHDERDPETTMSYLAKRGRILKHDGDAYLVMFDGQVHRSNNAETDKGVQIVDFDQYMLNISTFSPTGDSDRTLKPKELSLWELLNPDPENVKGGMGKIRSELHERISSPLYPMLFTFLAVSVLGHARTTRQSRWGPVMFVVGLAIAVRIAGITMTNLVALNPWAVVPLYAIPVIAILVAAWAAHVRMAPELRSKLSVDLKSKLPNIKFGIARGIKAK
ncbi:LPS export ABC transporter permease LptF [Methyloligella halotolerans]|nr:LPS export ABC transporter permease LptF [Methyloligella halotolerans]